MLEAGDEARLQEALGTIRQTRREMFP
jgi:hypothetical protein